ncbi:MAG: NUDIX domain-containing protein [Bacteroides sp.]|nr:NUDIX domain-containing protein [Bacteroides sp.]MCM1379244.1 NUDIX domain-containing protein [Bacteroides sp.]MCM1445098.1 NUDIX domain-containing protein [Prevotella sp.]
MRFKFCPDCSAELTSRVLGDEGAVPWCDRCGRPWFDMFPTAVISLVYNADGEVLLLRQGYISHDFCNLVSGYIQPGENAETTAVREIKEETGLEVKELELICTRWFPKKQMLMIGFFARVDSKELHLSGEVDSAEWHPAADILALLSTSPTSTSRFLAQKFLSRQCGK